MGHYHVNVYAEQLINAELIGIADVDKEKVEALAERYGIRAYIDYKELLNEVEAVSIAVPTALHYKAAKDCLEAGVHVLVEKPFTTTLGEAEELFDIAKRKNLVIRVGHVERFNGAVQELKKIIKDPLLIESRRIGPFISRVKDDSVIMDLMIHDIDIILNLVDSDILNYSALGRSVYSEKEDIATVQMLFENGCIATITASRASEHKLRTLAITQRDAYIFLDYTDQDIHIHRRADSGYFVSREEIRYKQESFIERLFVYKDNPLKLQIKHFLDCIENEDKRNLKEKDETRSLDIALKIINSLKGNKKV
ncbi:MAG: oxidoreductase [Candidatus Schekmanbacteria bacterium RIFCSPHIGHO2_02_FULL_38_11]|uniref:Oxidoreductase n=1 Tax=Candidatus Schekmanbacteria bacterium RIFCSPLOWO2_12_FULL_38_15 TaxID=1817883 RepID=A0A1F7SLC1_9BACT|nr:MAG: oxidoreductase [Candidatus Schekmanbacteria bacterium GWA2_38_9]OGL48071.1 MAG: oxidoreductase [Candidatus Schekmanbacteria bacterium RIFCSPLOWO2_02_FULL_38_14]OGL50718.1 MAG: oxidoreductase [Candidatus Schekmanbacteria bacterium RIFCSPHIGHO2_02_FULL_38_11]OGL54586.1 MAG: oxidoreductase [Candidatus Schekmanbacteria bacterium RIFCSPLOWO2_12_FULL_38_15]